MMCMLAYMVVLGHSMIPHEYHCHISEATCAHCDGCDNLVDPHDTHPHEEHHCHEDSHHHHLPHHSCDRLGGFYTLSDLSDDVQAPAVGFITEPEHLKEVKVEAASHGWRVADCAPPPPEPYLKDSGLRAPPAA